MVFHRRNYKLRIRASNSLVHGNGRDELQGELVKVPDMPKAKNVFGYPNG